MMSELGDCLRVELQGRNAQQLVQEVCTGTHCTIDKVLTSCDGVGFSWRNISKVC